MGNRLSMSFVNLGCANFGLTNPVTVTLDGNQVATAVTYNTAQQTAKARGDHHRQRQAGVRWRRRQPRATHAGQARTQVAR